jgi:hypothetical protein
MAINGWNKERPPRYSRPWLRLLAQYSGVLGMVGLFPVIIFAGNAVWTMLVYVLADLLVVGVALCATLVYTTRLRRRLQAAGGELCPDCGYDVRTLSNCPECGRGCQGAADIAYWRRHIRF